MITVYQIIYSHTESNSKIFMIKLGFRKIIFTEKKEHGKIRQNMIPVCAYILIIATVSEDKEAVFSTGILTVLAEIDIKTQASDVPKQPLSSSMHMFQSQNKPDGSGLCSICVWWELVYLNMSQMLISHLHADNRKEWKITNKGLFTFCSTDSFWSFPS